LEYKELFVFAVALGIAGFISYKTFQWVLYEEIGTGLASLFFGFAILVFLVINNYDFIRNWGFLRKTEVKAVREAIGEFTANSIELINAEFQKQKASMKPLTETVNKTAEATNGLAVEANERAQRAVKIAKDAKAHSEKLGAVQAWAVWEILMSDFLEIENYLKRWEEKSAFKRELPPAETVNELEGRLEALEKRINLPKTIKALYLERQRKYEILKRVKEAFGSHSDRFVKGDFSLPAPPKLPSAASMEAELVDRAPMP
jgi:hypothetical protein